MELGNFTKHPVINENDIIYVLKRRLFFIKPMGYNFSFIFEITMPLKLINISSTTTN